MNFNFIYKDIMVPTFMLTGEINDYEITQNLKNKILNFKDEKNLITNVKGLFTGFNYFVENIDFHNFIKSIKNEINFIFKENFTITNAWGNLLKKNGEVIEHNHRGVSGFCGILYLSSDGPGTYFKDYDITVQEKVGRFVLFSPLLVHKVEKTDKDVERITLAFNANLAKPWENNEDFKKINI
jgi:hypothetical protein